MAHYFYALAFFIAAQFCIRWHNLLTVRMIKAVNGHRPPNQQIPIVVLTRKIRRIVESEYQFYYPKSRLRTWSFISLSLGFLGFILTGVMFFKPGR